MNKPSGRCARTMTVAVGLASFCSAAFSLSRTTFASTPAAVDKDAASEARVRALAPHFSPPPGAMVAVDDEEARNTKAKDAITTLRGYIAIAPPPGACLFVIRTPTDDGTEVCRAMRLTFRVGELTTDGRVVWKVRRGKGDFGTELSWSTPHRIFRFINAPGAFPGPSQKAYLHRCEAKRDPYLGRVAQLSIFGGESWMVRLPKEDQLLPQPKPTRNLYMQIPEKKGVVAKAADHDGPTSPAGVPRTGVCTDELGQSTECPNRCRSGQGRCYESALRSEIEGESYYREPEDQPEVKRGFVTITTKKVQPWQMAKRHTYGMGTEYFGEGIGVPTGSKGSCRYQFSNAPGDRTSGWIECHGTGRFSFILMTLPCLGDLRTKDDADANHDTPSIDKADHH